MNYSTYIPLPQATSLCIQHLVGGGALGCSQQIFTHEQLDDNHHLYQSVDHEHDTWLSDPTHVGPSAQVVWPIVGQEILNGDVGGGFQGIQITSGFFKFGKHLE